MTTSLEVGHVSAEKLWNEMERCTDNQQQLKLVHRPTHISTQSQTPDLEQSFQVKHHREPNLQCQ